MSGIEGLPGARDAVIRLSVWGRVEATDPFVSFPESLGPILNPLK